MREPSVRRQCELLELPRSTAYYQADCRERREPGDHAFDRRALHGDAVLWSSSVDVVASAVSRVCHQSRSVCGRLLRTMGIEAVFPGRRTTKPEPGHKKYPYLLRDVEITRPNQVWSTDITYVPLRRGFMYLVAVMDWHSRFVLSWRLSNTLGGEFCVASLEEALARWGCPEIFNSDQGSQFTSPTFTGRLEERGIRVSMDGRGRALDNVFIERLWRSVKYEDIYLKDYDGADELYRGLELWFGNYGHRRRIRDWGIARRGRFTAACEDDRGGTKTDRATRRNGRGTESGISPSAGGHWLRFVRRRYAPSHCTAPVSPGPRNPRPLRGRANTRRTCEVSVPCSFARDPVADAPGSPVELLILQVRRTDSFAMTPGAERQRLIVADEFDIGRCRNSVVEPSRPKDGVDRHAAGSLAEKVLSVGKRRSEDAGVFAVGFVDARPGDRHHRVVLLAYDRGSVGFIPATTSPMTSGVQSSGKLTV